MFCKNCGMQLADDAKFCGACGAVLDAAPVSEETTILDQPPVEDAAYEETVVLDQQPIEDAAYEGTVVLDQPPVEEARVAEAPVYQPTPVAPVAADNGFAQPNFEQPAKKKKWPLILGIVGGVIAVLAVVVAVFFNSISGFFIKTFGSADQYFKYVEMQEFKQTTKDVAEVYGKFTDVLDTEESAGEATVKLNVDDETLDMLSAIVGEDVDLSFLNKVELTYDTNTKDSIVQDSVALKISDKKIVDLTAVADMNKQDIFVAVLSLSEKYLRLETDESVGSVSALMTKDMADSLPTDAELEDLLNKYLKIAIDNMDDVEKSTDTLEIGDIEQKVTVLEFTLDKKTVMNIAKDILKEAKSDETIKKYLKKIEKVAEKNGLSDDTDLYSMYKEGISDLLDELNDAEFENEDLLTIIDYVNSSHEIVGRTIEVKDTEILSYATAKDGDDFATEINCQNLVVKGSGTEKSDVVNGKYTIFVDTQEVLTIKVTDCDTSKVDDGIVSGKFLLTPSSALLEEMVGTGIMDISLEIEVKTTEDTGMLKINAISKEKSLFGFELNSKTKKATTVKLPDSSKVYSQDQITEWASEFDLSKITSALKDAGVDANLVDLLDYYINYSTGGSNDDWSDYDDDDWSDYDDDDWSDYDDDDWSDYDDDDWSDYDDDDWSDYDDDDWSDYDDEDEEFLGEWDY